MKLQINSLEALERLIGGDTEVELDIRNSVVQAFAKKHLKEIATSAVIYKVSEDVKSAAIAVAKHQTETELDKLGMFKRGIGWGQQTFVLNDKIKAELQNEVLSAVNTKIKEVVADTILKFDDERIQKRIDRLVDEHVHTKIAEGVKAKLNEIQSKLLQA